VSFIAVTCIWRVKEGFKRQQCIELYEAFAVRLLEKKELYQRKFGLVPRFKASINEGLVTVAEIGQIKTEIAYHWRLGILYII
jgi:adenylate cyclase